MHRRHASHNARHEVRHGAGYQVQHRARHQTRPRWLRAHRQASSHRGAVTRLHVSDIPDGPDHDDLRVETAREVWEYLMHLEEQAPMTRHTAPPIDGSRYWIIMLLLVMTMTGATLYGISMDIL